MSFGIGSICRSHMVLLWLWGRTQLQFDSTPSLGISICCQCGHKKEMEKKKQPNQWICRHLQPASFAQPVNPHLIICWPLIKENPEIPRLPSCFSEVSGPESPAAVQYALDMRAPFGPPSAPGAPLPFSLLNGSPLRDSFSHMFLFKCHPIDLVGLLLLMVLPFSQNSSKYSEQTIIKILSQKKKKLR